MQKVDGLDVTTAECHALISTLHFPSTDPSVFEGKPTQI